MVATLTDPAILLPAYVMIAVLATFYTLAAPYLDRGDLYLRADKRRHETRASVTDRRS